MINANENGRTFHNAHIFTGYLDTHILSYSLCAREQITDATFLQFCRQEINLSNCTNTLAGRGEMFVLTSWKNGTGLPCSEFGKV